MVPITGCGAMAVNCNTRNSTSTFCTELAEHWNGLPREVMESPFGDIQTPPGWVLCHPPQVTLLCRGLDWVISRSPFPAWQFYDSVKAFWSSWKVVWSLLLTLSSSQKSSFRRHTGEGRNEPEKGKKSTRQLLLQELYLQLAHSLVTVKHCLQ